MYVDALSEDSRTRVRFPPPPPFLKREALDIQGLFVFGGSRKLGFQTVSSDAKQIGGKIHCIRR